MNYLEEEDEVYVTDGTYGYAISFNGNKYSVRNVEATLTGIDTVKESVYIASPSDFTDSDSTYTTGPYDFGLSGYKTLQSFTVECPFIEQVQGSVYYSDDGITWDWSDWLDLSDNGNVHYTVTAKFFKLSIKVDKSIDTGFINAVSCAVQTPDKRTFTNLAIGGNSGNNTRS
jgi:hypothetical protein